VALTANPFSCGPSETQMGYFTDSIYGGKRDTVGWRMIGYPGARYNYPITHRFANRSVATRNAHHPFPACVSGRETRNRLCHLFAGSRNTSRIYREFKIIRWVKDANALSLWSDSQYLYEFDRRPFIEPAGGAPAQTQTRQIKPVVSTATVLMAMPHNALSGA